MVITICVLVMSCNKKNESLHSTNKSIDAKIDIIEKTGVYEIKQSENAKMNISLDDFLSTADYRYFKQQFPGLHMNMDKSKIYGFNIYSSIFAVSIPYDITNNKLGLLMILKNFKNNKIESFVKEIIIGNDTIVRMYRLRDLDDGIRIVFRNGKINTETLRPNAGCKGDSGQPNYDCYLNCDGFSSCFKCSVNQMMEIPLVLGFCMIQSDICAFAAAVHCSGIFY